MIKPFDEYTPEEREFVEYVQKLRSQPPRPPYVPGPTNWEELWAIARQVPQEDRDALVEIIREAKYR
jgi:hypothetical protein